MTAHLRLYCDFCKLMRVDYNIVQQFYCLDCRKEIQMCKKCSIQFRPARSTEQVHNDEYHFQVNII